MSSKVETTKSELLNTVATSAKLNELSSNVEQLAAKVTNQAQASSTASPAQLQMGASLDNLLREMAQMEVVTETIANDVRNVKSDLSAQEVNMKSFIISVVQQMFTSFQAANTKDSLYQMMMTASKDNQVAHKALTENLVKTLQSLYGNDANKALIEALNSLAVSSGSGSSSTTPGGTTNP